MLLQIDMKTFKIRSSIVSSAITSSIKAVQVSIDSKLVIQNIYVNSFIEVIMIGKI